MKMYMTFVLVMVIVIASVIPATSARSDCTEPVPKLFRRVSPAVVFVSAVSIDPFKINDRVSISAGSGFIINKDGLVLTNSHLIFGNRAISVTLDNGRVVRAELVGIDPILDLAVLRIPKRTADYPVVTLGNSEKIEVGDEVMAIGNPLGLEQTLTLGVVSGVNRTLSAAPMSLQLPLIQTDAAINPGNSGGPLVNKCGEIIGINTAMLGDAQSIGFAIPINVAKNALPELIEHGRIIRPWLGVRGKLIQKDLGEIINLPLVNGFLVETIEPESPAESAGLQDGELPVIIAGLEFLLGGDIIIAANGQPLDNRENFDRFVRSLHVGDKVRLTVYYEGKTREVEIVLSERPILPGDF